MRIPIEREMEVMHIISVPRGKERRHGTDQPPTVESFVEVQCSLRKVECAVILIHFWRVRPP